MIVSARRDDIDGLRCVAILSVLLFHFGFSFIPGGYTGVDVFFVISGYVITKSIHHDIAKERFSIGNFYFKRFRRITPAFAATLLLTSVACYFLLLPDDLIDFGKSAAAASGFASNFYFWKTSGYFASAAQTKPLLHTWSLSVEEQFYIFAPILIYALTRLSTRKSLWALAVIMLISLCASVAAIFLAPTFGFFGLPSRAWELLIGVWLATRDPDLSLSRTQREALGFIGAGLIGAGMLFLHEDDPFPGWYALLPCLGTAFCIAAGTNARGRSELSMVGRALSWRPAVWIGWISYSVYLVHWPIAALFQYRMLRAPTPVEGLIMAAISLMLGLLSWRFIEQPTRHIDPRYMRHVIVGGVATGLAGVAFGLVPVMGDGFAGRYPLWHQQKVAGLEDWGGAQCFHQDPTTPIDWDAAKCTRIHGEKGRILLWGDSFAAQYTPGILRHGALINSDVLQYTFAGCPPLLSYNSLARTGCRKSNQRIPDLIRQQHIDTVVMAAKWTDVPRHTLLELPDTIETLRRAGVRVIIIGQSPEFAMDVQRIDYLSGQMAQGDKSRWMTSVDADFNAKMVALTKGASFIDPMGAFCDGRLCQYKSGSAYYFVDYGHFSREGSMRAVEAYFPSMAQHRGVQL